MVRTAVTALLIVSNEAEFLPGCIASISESVDEILVVDTGSLDNTVELARQAGARVVHFPWVDDFAAARNFAIASCRTPWALYIDADERLAPGFRGPIRSIIDPRWLAADVLLRPRANYTPCRLTRLFRIDPRIRFEGAIHETILPSLERASGAGKPIALTGLEIDHLGYEGDLTAKHHRNLPLLLRCVEEWPGRVYYRLHLAETLLGLGRIEESLEAGRAGIALAQRASAERQRIDGAVICQLLAARQLQYGADAIDLISAGLVLHPENHGLLLTLAQRHLHFGDAHLTLDIARGLQAIDPNALTPGVIAYDRDVFGRRAIEMEIASLRRLSRMGEAVAVLAAKAPRLLA